MAYRLVVFDFDGTLADSERCISASMSAALAEFGLAADSTRLRSHIGLPLDRTIRGIVDLDLGDDQVEAIVRSYRRHHAVLQNELVELYPGTLDTLAQLSASGVVLTIASSKITAAVDAALEHFDIGRFFACVVGGEQVANGKPASDMVDQILAITRRPREEALMVGDTTFDVEMAHNARIDCCAVTYGNQTREQLLLAQPSFLVASIREVAGIVERSVDNSPKGRDRGR
jgi:phosphoglycolate phosphatase